MQRIVPARPPVQVFGFSQRVIDALRQVNMHQHREIDTSSPEVRVTGLKCQACGFEKAVDYTTPADALRAVTFTHALSWDTGQRCGGQFAFTTES